MLYTPDHDPDADSNESFDDDKGLQESFEDDKYRKSIAEGHSQLHLWIANEYVRCIASVTLFVF